MFCFLIKTLNSQTHHLKPNITSPNVSNLGTYGNIPINYFTGKPNISIPIYTLNSGNIEVPIELSYHPDNVKPKSQPGWVGFGWNLNSGGSITRQVRGHMDEFYGSYWNNIHLYSAYYPYPDGLSPPLDNVLHGSDRINGPSNWADTSTLLDYLSWNQNYPFQSDILADEFSFNFLGYSGKFFYSGENKGWQVISDHHLKIELVEGEEFLEKNDIYDAIDEYTPNNLVYRPSSHYQSRYFGKFRIITPDGTKYEFGGKKGVEMTSAYATEQPTFSVNTWRLVKIIDVNGNIVDFDYKRNLPTCNFSFSAFDSSVSYQTTGNPNESSSASSMSRARTDQLSSTFVWPIYLKKISCATVDINFNSVPMARTESLYYTDSQINRPNVKEHALNPNRYKFYLVDNQISNIKWEKLNTIDIRDKSGGNRREVHQFNYSSNANQKLTLTDYFKATHLYQERKHFYFDYNNINSFNNITCDGNYSDHWGYLNKINANDALVSAVNTKKAVNTSYLTDGLLNKITYPTGGFTQFIWEPNEYSKVVSKNRQSLYTSIGYAGGVRIKEVNSFSDSNGVLVSSNKYYYKKNFSNSAPINSLTSSGILNGIPQYYFSFQNRPFDGGGGSTSFQVGNFNSITGYGYSGQGSHIGYDEVVEENMDGSYSKYYYTSYGPDINGKTHYDKNPVNYTGFVPSEDTYMPYSLLDVERGKKVGVFHYNHDNKLIEKNITKYRSDNGRFNQYIRTIPMIVSVATNSGSNNITLISATKEFTYNYYPIEEIKTSYDLNGNNPIVNITKFEYNGYDQISKLKKYDSDNSEFVTEFKYPHNYTSNSVFLAMKNKNFISPIVNERNLKNNSQINAMKTNYFSPYPNIYVPSNIKKQKNNFATEEVIEEFLNYDAKGNLLEMSKENGVKEIYIWGYQSQYPVAKVVIKNKTYFEIEAVLNMSVISNPVTIDFDMITELDKIRQNFPNAMVTTYTYDNTYGSITSITDPKGRSIFYVYDDIHRLKFIKDHEGKVLNEYKYNYKTN
ncbi:hypothetical protein LPB138_08800 [Urechidicola croceus]|uniref:YD repeat-containing protein n=2 Tax=Urechidicola croceus TaxID=1850246 RepID=A0A1D8P873_9FLAO|nr:hypothetical protein LPB138_08800 [Urechidicola croceus]